MCIELYKISSAVNGEILKNVLSIGFRGIKARQKAPGIYSTVLLTSLDDLIKWLRRSGASKPHAKIVYRFAHPFYQIIPRNTKFEDKRPWNLGSTPPRLSKASTGSARRKTLDVICSYVQTCGEFHLAEFDQQKSTRRAADRAVQAP